MVQKTYFYEDSYVLKIRLINQESGLFIRFNNGWNMFSDQLGYHHLNDACRNNLPGALVARRGLPPLPHRSKSSDLGG
jgi:hypothetical protein